MTPLFNERLHCGEQGKQWLEERLPVTPLFNERLHCGFVPSLIAIIAVVG